MKKFFVISLILFLILFTALIKNSTKRIDDDIFVIKESIRALEKEFNDLKLEYIYLSSGKKLLELQSKFFEEDLKAKRSYEIKVLSNNKGNKIIKNLKIFSNCDASRLFITSFAEKSFKPIRMFKSPIELNDKPLVGSLICG